MIHLAQKSFTAETPSNLLLVLVFYSLLHLLTKQQKKILEASSPPPPPPHYTLSINPKNKKQDTDSLHRNLETT
jgi:hypothetical protein